MRAGKALACTEDILNLKDSRAKIFAALENNDLPTAVKHLKHVHSIDKHALEISDDYHQILSKEAEIKSKVQQAFQAAIESSDIEQVMLYCPLLQFLQLQYEARDNLLLFFNEKIFISLDSEHVLANTNATDASTAYLQGLLHIFNTFYIIIQTYLPIVLQGLEECSGDIYFIRNLHKKVELEASRIIKKFIKYRNLNEFVQNLARFPPQSSSSTTATNASMMSAAEIHALMDEVAVVIQYCSKYSKYLKHIAHGAEARVRPSPTTATSSAAPSNPQTVFTYPLDFDKMIDELVSKYYLVGDYYLIKSVALNPSNLDVLYFVLQKCGLRSIATNHIHATLSIHQLIINTISGEVVDSLNSSMGPAVAKILSTVNDYYQKYKKPLIDMNSTAMNASSSNNILSRGLFSLISTSSSSSSSSGGDHHASSSSAAQEDLSMIMEMFNTMEVAASYTERLGKDLFAAGENVFSSSFDQSSPSTTSHAASTATATANTSKGTGKKAKETTSVFHIASDVEKLQACRESFESAKQSLFNLMKQVAEKVTMGLHPIFKDLFYLTADPAHSNLFIQYNLPDQRFEDQSNLVVLPRIIVVPVENILYLLTNNLSEKAKSLLIAFTAEVCCEKLEGFIRQVSSYSSHCSLMISSNN